MADTDLLTVLSEILIKQDRQTEILTQFMEVHVRQFQTELHSKSVKSTYHRPQPPASAEKIGLANPDLENLSSIERILNQMLALEFQIRRLERPAMGNPGISVTE